MVSFVLIKLYKFSVSAFNLKEQIFALKMFSLFYLE